MGLLPPIWPLLRQTGGFLDASVVTGDAPQTNTAPSGRTTGCLLYAACMGSSGSSITLSESGSNYTGRVASAGPTASFYYALAKSRTATSTSSDNFTCQSSAGATMYDYLVAVPNGSVTYATSHGAHSGGATSASPSAPRLSAPSGGTSYLVVIGFANTSGTGPVIATPSGYTALDNRVINTASAKGAVFSKVVGSGTTAPTSVSISASGSTVCVGFVFEFFVA